MYQEFFGFKEKPFNVTPDPRFLYLSPGHQEALATMLYGIQERRGFVSVIGEIGTGKTTLVHTLFNELGSDVQTAFIFNTKLNFKQLLQNILLELELTPTSNAKPLLLNQLNDFLIKKLAVNEIVALIIDEAQNLSSSVLEELRMLSNLETTKHKLLQILLVGQPELDFKLRSHNLRQLKQRIGINCYLTPLNNEEQQKYIGHRLNIAGRSTQQIFSPKALELICQNAKGIPRIINILCDNALLSAYSKGTKKVDHNILQEVIADFDRKNSPLAEIVDTPSTSNNNKPKKSKKIIITLLLLFFIIQFLIIGIFLYINNPGYFSQIFKSILSSTPVSSQQNTIPSGSIAKQEIVETQTEQPSFLKEADKAFESIEKAQELPVEQILSLTEKAPLMEETVSSFSETSSIPPQRSPQAEKLKPVIAQDGDIVSAIALVHYGTINDTLIDIIKRANPDIVDLNRIEIGQTINFPTLDIDNFIIETKNGSFTIHVATFSAYDNAIRLHKKLERINASSSISPAKIVGNNFWYRVTVGNFSSRSQAIEYAKNNTLDGAFYIF